MTRLRHAPGQHLEPADPHLQRQDDFADRSSFASRYRDRPDATPTGNTTIDLTDNEHRVYADERRTQIDMRFAKTVRFGRTRADIGVDLSNLLNTNYATGFNETYVLGTDETPRPAGWGTPTGIYTARFVWLNFTVNF